MADIFVNGIPLESKKNVEIDYDVHVDIKESDDLGIVGTADGTITSIDGSTFIVEFYSRDLSLMEVRHVKINMETCEIMP